MHKVCFLVDNRVQFTHPDLMGNELVCIFPFLNQTENKPFKIRDYVTSKFPRTYSSEYQNSDSLADQLSPQSQGLIVFEKK